MDVLTVSAHFGAVLCMRENKFALLWFFTNCVFTWIFKPEFALKAQKSAQSMKRMEGSAKNGINIYTLLTNYPKNYYAQFLNLPLNSDCERCSTKFSIKAKVKSRFKG